jgi:WD40 repeat protein
MADRSEGRARPAGDPAEHLEQLWRQGRPPALGPFLAAAGALEPAQLVAVVRVDQRQRWQTGERVPTEAYLHAYPALADAPEAALELVYGEFLLREQHGESPALDEYQRRFPQYAARLRQQLLLHQAMASESQLGSDTRLRSDERLPGAPATPLPTPSAADLAGFPAVPGYEIVAELGQGGMGVVYKAWHTGLRRLVALKMVRADTATPDGLARFKAEAEAVARLQHPHIVQIYDIGEHQGRLYLALECVEGGSLASKLGGQPLPAREAAVLIAALARAVHHAHQRGILHRDLKPANVLLSADGTPKVTDFGLAKLVAGGEVQTQTGVVLGTPSYMPPEQARGQTKAVGPAADVYALGAVLYQCLTGRPPFVAETALHTLYQVVHDEPVSPRQLQSRVPRDLETICLKCLQKEPAKRYGSAAALAEDVQRYLEGQPVQARPAARLERVAKWVRRQPALAALVVVSGVAALALVGFVVSLYYSEDLRRSRHQAEDALEESRTNLEKANTYQYFLRIGMAERSWWANNVGRTRELLAECEKGRRGWEWHYLDRLCHSELLTLAGHEGEVLCVVYSPDGKYLASGGTDQTVRIWDAATGEFLFKLPGHTKEVYGVAFSPDGTKLASAAGVGSPGEVKVWAVDWPSLSGKPLLSRPGLTGASCKVAFSPDGRRLAIASGEIAGKAGRVTVIDVTDDTDVFSRTAPHETVFGVAFSPDGRHLVSASGATNISTVKSPGLVQIWDAGTGEERPPLKGHTGAVEVVAFSPQGPQGKFLASAGADRMVKLWDTTQGYQEVRTLRGHTAEIQTLAFRPDGQQLATAGDDMGVKVWDLTTWEELYTLRGHAGEVTGLAYHPDGLRLASSGKDGVVRVWDATTSQEARTLRGHEGTISGVAFSSDGEHLASGSHDRTVRLWDLSPEGRSRPLGPHREPVWCVAFSPDGRRLASGSGDWQKKEQLGEVKVWDVATGRELWTRQAHAGLVFGLAFSPDGRQLATAGGELYTPGEVKIWDLDTGSEQLSITQPKGVRQVRFSPDGSLLAGVLYGEEANSGALKVWNAATGKELLHVVQGSSKFRCVAFSPDGRWLATGCSDQTVRVWEATTGKLRETLRGHNNEVIDVAFSPDGSRLASASGDHYVKLWDVATGQEVLTLRGHHDFVWSVAFSPDGWRIASGGDDRLVKVWDATPLASPSPARAGRPAVVVPK